MGNLVLKAADSLWAKKSTQSGEPKWLPLMTHLQDTMNVAEFLWNHWLSSGQREGIVSQIQNGNEVLAERLIMFLAGVHDIGKATPAFQTQRGFVNSEDLEEELIDKLELAGFSDISDYDVRFGHFTHHALAGEVITRKLGVNEGIASIVGAHHGKPVDDEMVCEDQDAYVANYYQTEINTSVSQLWKDTQAYIFEWALNQSELYQKESLPELSRPAQVLLSGLLIMADWIASNESYFPLISIEKNSVEDMQLRFQNGIKHWYHDQPFDVQEPVSSEELYPARFGFLPRDFQKVIFDTIQSVKKPGIVIIEAPTGCGKTEAALAAAEQLAVKTGRSGMFFGLPTQATSNGMFPRIVQWTTSLVNAYGSVASIQLRHGKSALNPLMNKLSSHINEDEDSDDTLIVNQWFAGRKTAALDDFVVGTVDQFLMVSLKQKHLALRHLGFDRKVVIIDEVHAYDAYMQQYLTEAVRWMGAYGVPVILLSATLPAEKRKELAVAYLRGSGLKEREISQSKADLNTAKYPLITYSDGAEILQNSGFPVQKDKKVKIQKLDEAELYSVLGKSIRDGGVVGVIVNTVRRSQEIAKRCTELFGTECVVLLHSNFIATDRVEKENLLLSMIGKNANRPEKLIVVGTQVIEQSLDIDFDVLITDLCPMDLLIQRIGRLHRHAINRPRQHRQAVAYLLGMSENLEFDQGSARVYGEYLLARTQWFLPSEINIPSSVSTLVQKVYGSTEYEPDFKGEQRELYEKWKAEFRNQSKKKEDKAKNFRIDNPVRKINTERYNLIGWLKTPDESTTDEEAYAQVRDTRETLEIIAVRRYKEKYGFFLPHNQQERAVSDYITDSEMAKKLANQTLRLPYSVIQRTGINRLIHWLEEYNKKNLRDWQSQTWLKGSLGLIFEEDGTFKAEEQGILLRYDFQYGLEVQREEK
jgi:CRISPR-associated endonuclease/helicase Cas3